MVGVFITLVAGQGHQAKIDFPSGNFLLHGADIALYRFKNDIGKNLMKSISLYTGR